jgi:mannose-1-phosphate guanylyltransferase/mannose-6-phosphate isomerase
LTIVPIVLSGGSGTRLWPLSRDSRPKQFLRFQGDHSLIQQTLLRLRHKGFDARPIIISADAHRFLVQDEIRELSLDADIVLEPCRRNSCAAIAAGCELAVRRNPDAIVLVLASDHLITETDMFHRAALSAMDAAQQGFLVTFGVQPQEPSTAYGYILPGEKLDGLGARRIERFVEKPSLALAQKYVDAGYLWNSGNFMFKASAFLNELDRHEPKIRKAVTAAVEGIRRDLEFLRLPEAEFSASPSISVDYAVMEKTDRAAVMPVSYAWSDIGSWDSVWRESKRDEDGNAAIGDTIVAGAKNNYVHSNDHVTALLGVEDLVVVVTRDAALVAKRSSAESVKALVETLAKGGRREATESTRIFRPWGNHERLDRGDGYQIKRIVVNPGGVLSLRKHPFRAEHWIIVSGEADVTIGDETKTLRDNQSIFVPQGETYRLVNRAAVPLIMIEVQTGPGVDDVDTQRLEDFYNAPPTR